MSLRFAELRTALSSPPFFALRARTSSRRYVREEKRERSLPAELTCLREDTETTTRLKISGALDIHSAPEIRPIFDNVATANKRCVTLDLDGLTMLDSSGVGAIVSLFKRVKATGGIVIVEGIHGQPLAIFQLLKLDRAFGI